MYIRVCRIGMTKKRVICYFVGIVIVLLEIIINYCFDKICEYFVNIKNIYI